LFRSILPSPAFRRLFPALALALGSLLGCLDQGGSRGDLYVFDGQSGSVLVWGDQLNGRFTGTPAWVPLGR